MKKMFCPYCGEPLTEECECERIAEENREWLLEELEEEQHKNGFYAFQDMVDMYRRER